MIVNQQVPSAYQQPAQAYASVAQISALNMPQLSRRIGLGIF